MEALIIVLNDLSKFEDLCVELMNRNVRGGTIMDSTGLYHTIGDFDDDDFHFGGLRALLNPKRKKSKTLFFVGNEKQISVIIDTVKEVIDINAPDTGMMFTFPVRNIFGVKGVKDND